jgi:pilus assembly protein FimV
MNPQARSWWIGLAGALTLLLVGGVALLKLRKRQKASAETSFLESKLQHDSFFGGSGGQQVDTREAAQPAAAEQYSLSQLDAIGDVDPVAEADVYLAYGRDLQAEEILKEAMRSNPQRLAIRTKLLEVYAKRQDVKAFELLAQQLQQITQGEGEDWARVRELGQQIDPDNPLYAEPPATPPREPDTMAPSSWPTDIESPAPRPPVERLDLDLDQLAKAPAQSLERTRPLVTQVERPAPAVATSAAALAAVAHDAGPASRAPQPDPSETVPPLDFGPTESPSVPAPTPVPPEGAPALPFDLDSLSLDLDEPSTASVLSELNLSGFGEDEADPLQRKLDLAEEFRQIGENDAARDLLQEVVAQASGDVKVRAQSMLDSLV